MKGGLKLNVTMTLWFPQIVWTSPLTANIPFQHLSIVCMGQYQAYIYGANYFLYIPQELYDTLVDNVGSPTIFVAMKDSQAYPRYWITFKIT